MKVRNKYPISTNLCLLFLFVGVFSVSTGFFSPVSNHIVQLPNDFILGINGHPLVQKDYMTMPFEEQVKYLESFGMTYYRIDCPIDVAGNIKNGNKLSSLYLACNARHIKLLPSLVMSAKTLSIYTDSTSAYDAGKRVAATVSDRYGEYFDHYELGNELDLVAIKFKGASGVDVNDYDPVKMKIIAAYLNGMNSGIKQTNTNAKTIVNCSGPHSGFILALKQLNVQFDIIGQHYYTLHKSFAECSDFQATNKNLLEIYNYTKDIWITEFNQFRGTASFKGDDNREESQKAIINDFIKNCKKQKYNKALFIYELLDEPNLVVGTGGESERHLGIIKNENQNLKLKEVAKSLSGIK